MNKAVFLDRDGVINDGTLYYTYKPEDFFLNSGVIEGLRKLQQANYLLIIVTNQGGVAKGKFSIEDVEKTHHYMRKLLEAKGIYIDAIYYCPHHSDISDCECRKPKPGMLSTAIIEYNIDQTKSYLIGDSPRDIESADSAGVKGIKIEKNENILPYCINIVDGCVPNMR